MAQRDEDEESVNQHADVLQVLSTDSQTDGPDLQQEQVRSQASNGTSPMIARSEVLFGSYQPPASLQAKQRILTSRGISNAPGWEDEENAAELVGKLQADLKALKVKHKKELDKKERDAVARHQELIAKVRSYEDQIEEERRKRI